MITARQVGHRVEDTSQETAYGHTYANPDGTWTTESYAGPVQAQDDHGDWHPINPTLTSNPDGSIAPKVSAADLTFGGGGSTRLATMTVDGKPVTWTWPTALPKPTIDGPTATYQIDDFEQLVLTATSNGFSQDIVLLKAPPSVWQVPTPTISGAAGDVTSNGSMTFAAPSGKALVTSSAPFAFDSSKNPGGDPAVSPLAAALTPITATKQKLSLTPVAAFLAAKSTVYPVTIDPSYTATPAAASVDTWVQTPGYTASQYNSTELKAGTYDGGTDVARTFIKFGGTTWTGRHILSAQFRVRNWYSSSCTGSAVRVAEVTDSWSQTGISWANQPNWTTTNHSDLTAAHGYNSSCGAADAVWDITGIAQDWSKGTAQNGIVIKGLTETDSNTWRRYRSTEYGDPTLAPRITYTYNNYPNTASTPTATSPTASNAGYVTSTTPTFHTTLSDPDGGTLRAVFDVYQGSTEVYSSPWTSYVSNKGSASLTIPTGHLVNGGTYTVKAIANDGTDSAKAWSASSTSFTVDTSKPSTTITGTGFAMGQWLSAAPASNTFVLHGPTDTKSFSFQEDDGAWQTKSGTDIAVSSTEASAQVPWLPKSGGHAVTAYAVDKAGNKGSLYTFTFGVGDAPDFTSPGADAPSTGSFPLNINGPPGASGATFSWRYAGTSTWHTMAQVDAASGGPWTGTALANTSDESRTPALIWDAASETDPTKTGGGTLSAPALVEIQGCFNYPGAASRCSMPREVQLVPSAFGGSFPTATLGPAQVALFTGEMSLAESDAVDQQAGVARSFSTFDAATASTGGIFGPGWSAGIAASSDSSMEVIDDRAQDRTFVLVGDGGVSQIFTPANASDNILAPTADVKFVPAGVDDSSVLTMSKDQSTLTLTRLGGDTTQWTYQTDAGATSGTWEPQSGLGLDGTKTEVTNTGTYPTFIAETAPGNTATCTVSVQDAGCRALKFLYTGTGASQRVSEIDLIRSGESPLPVANYTYTDGLLTKVCGTDPDGAGSLPALCSNYSYDTTSVEGRTLLKTLTPPGQATWTFTYDDNPDYGGRLLSVSRPAATGSGNATWSVDYTLPATGNSDLPDLRPETTAGWDEDDAPTKVIAVTGPSGQGKGVHAAALFYTDAVGNTVNTATYGDVTSIDPDSGATTTDAHWSITTHWYNDAGDIIRSLDPAGLQAALADPADETTIAYDRSSVVVYNDKIVTPDGVIQAGARITDEYGAAHESTLLDGTTGEYRAHTHYTYDDEDRSLGGAQRPAYTSDNPSWGLVVEVESNAASANDLSEVHDTKKARNTYAPPVVGDGNGWTFGTPSQTSIVKADGTQVVTGTTRLDSSGNVIESRQPGGATDASGAGSDAHATVASYYAKTSTDPDCEISGHSERAGWEGLTCKTKPAAQPTGSVTAPVPTTWNQSYNDDLQPTVERETSGTATRMTTTVYDALGRPTKVTVDDGHDVRVQSIGYDPASGLPASIAGIGSSSDTGGTIVTEHDSWGRTNRYTDASGAVTSTSYSVDGAPSQVTDANGTTIYDYTNGALTSMNTTAGAGSTTFTVDYDADGNVATVGYGTGLTATYLYNEAGAETAIDYLDSNGYAVASFNDTLDVNGKVVEATSVVSDQHYSYDLFGRLTNVQDTRAGTCTSRVYGFDATSDRTSLNTYAPAADGTCQITTASKTRSWTYDDANRISSSGYTYDSLGRTLTAPKIDTNAAADAGASALNLGYYANDMVASVAQTITGSTGASEVDKDAYGLDASGRISEITSTVNGTETRTQSFRFGDDSDMPTAVTTHTEAVGSNPASTTTTRYVTLGGLGLLASIDNSGITYQLQNLHGDTVVTVDGAGIIDSYCETDEYGNDTTSGGTSAGSHRTNYGYLGRYQRAGGFVGGVVLMGMRLFNPTTGTFLSVDPVFGGNLTAYGYPADPINWIDPSGAISCGACNWLVDKGKSVGGAFLDGLGHVSGAVKSALSKLGGKLLSWYMSQHDVGTSEFSVGLRNGRPAIHWNNHQNRLEWDQRNGWHYNIGKEHYSYARGVSDLAKLSVARPPTYWASY